MNESEFEDVKIKCIIEIKKLLNPFPEFENADNEFIKRKAEELYYSEYVR